MHQLFGLCLTCGLLSCQTFQLFIKCNAELHHGNSIHWNAVVFHPYPSSVYVCMMKYRSTVTSLVHECLWCTIYFLPPSYINSLHPFILLLVIVVAVRPSIMSSLSPVPVHNVPRRKNNWPLFSPSPEVDTHQALLFRPVQLLLLNHYMNKNKLDGSCCLFWSRNVFRACGSIICVRTSLLHVTIIVPFFCFFFSFVVATHLPDIPELLIVYKFLTLY